MKNFKDSPKINSVRKGRGRRWADAHLGRERIMTEFRSARVKGFYYESVLKPFYRMIGILRRQGRKKCIDVIFSGVSRWPLSNGLIKRF